MNIIVLAAGDCKRFNGFEHSYKPLIDVNGIAVIKRTTDSLGFKGFKKDNCCFAIRCKHNSRYNVVDKIHEIYKNENLFFNHFEKLTKGNLITAYETSNCNFLDDLDKPLLILDSDNAYNGNGILKKFKQIKFGCGICHFDPIDDSDKWGFAFQNNSKLFDIREKDPTALKDGGKPMVGVFYFSSGELFRSLASLVILKNKMERGEFYMTQSIKAALNLDIPVFSYKVTNPIPLGTPEDIIKAREKLQN